MRACAAEQRREGTAYHEAGHAVARYRLRLPIRSATIIPDEQSGNLGSVRGGFPKAFRPDRNSDLRTLDRIEKEIVARLTGSLAEKKHTGRADHVGTARDYEWAADLAFYRFGGGEVVDAYLRFLGVLTQRNVASPLWWRAIEVVAAALLERGTLSGRAVRLIVRADDEREVERVSGPGIRAILRASDTTPPRGWPERLVTTL